MSREVEEWLREQNLVQYAEAFADNDVDMDLLAELSESDLERLGVASLGHRKRLLKAIARLRTGRRAARKTAATRPDPALPRRRAEAERRHMSVMFCDLVDSVALAATLDPEDLRNVMQPYQDVVAKAVIRYGGHVSQYLGDGVLACFGWPWAYEDQAERAIQAGLDALADVGRMTHGGANLRARVAIASGQVVVGEMSGEKSRDVEAVTGETPNKAARLQGIAGPGELVIDARTVREVGTAFDLRDLGPHNLKGFSSPVHAWLVLGAGPAATRFSATHPGRLSHFVNREHELALIRERWLLAKRSEGQAVLLSGEAGIGKSRTLEALRGTMRGECYFRLQFQCSPFHANSTFHPIIQFLKRNAGFTANRDDDRRFERLEALLRLPSQSHEDEAPLIAGLLSLPVERRYGASSLTPQQMREQTIEALIGQLIDLSQRRPVFIVLEDAHWIDPTTEALIGDVLPRIADVPVFLVVTYRPDYSPAWADLPHLARIHLNRLSREQGIELVEDIGGRELAAKVVDEIVTRADGVPLFAEELTKSLIESGDDQGEVPLSLHASLVARLDRLGEAAKLAQLAAVIGRAFNYRFIQASGPEGGRRSRPC